VIRHLVDWYIGTNILEQLAASIFRVVQVEYLGGGRRNLLNVGVCIPTDNVLSQEIKIYINYAVRTLNLAI
jgi:hypothetical protein